MTKLCRIIFVSNFNGIKYFSNHYHTILRLMNGKNMEYNIKNLGESFELSTKIRLIYHKLKLFMTLTSSDDLNQLEDYNQITASFFETLFLFIFLQCFHSLEFILFLLYFISSCEFSHMCDDSM